MEFWKISIFDLARDKIECRIASKNKKKGPQLFCVLLSYSFGQSCKPKKLRTRKKSLGPAKKPDSTPFWIAAANFARILCIS